MNPEIERALREAAVKAGIIDDDLVKLDCFDEFVADARAEDAEKAVLKMMQAKPKFFKSWDELKPQDFEARETVMLEGVRKSTEAPRQSMGEFRFLDAGRLDANELRALENALARGWPNPQEKACLTSALARQLNEANTIKGTA